MKNRLQDLRVKRAEVGQKMAAILDQQETEARTPTEDEETAYAALQASMDQLNSDITAEDQRIERRRALAEQALDLEDAARPLTVAAPVGPFSGQITVGQDRAELQPFASFGEQLQAIAYAGMNKGADQDPRLHWAVSTGAGEAVPSEGGFLVQRDFSTDLLALMHDQGQLLSRVRTIPISANANGIKLPTIDETSRVNGSRWGGVQGYWADEAGTVTETRPKFGRIELDLKKLMAIGYVTEELLRDSAALEVIMSTAFTEELVFKVEDAIINGTGSGQPLGILNSGGLVTVDAEIAQVAATVVSANILNIHSRMPSRQRGAAIWLINQEIEPQLYTMALPAADGSALVMLYRPPGSNDVAGVAAFGTLLGRPVVPVEYCAALGTVGDIMLVALSEYLLIDKGGVRQDSSMHVRFLYDEMTFRFIYRVDGQPAWKSAVTPFKGTLTYSPFVALATRS